MLRRMCEIGDFLAKRQGLDENTIGICKYENVELDLVFEVERYYLLEGVDRESSCEMKYLIYDCSGNERKFDFKEYSMVKENDVLIQVFIFNNWQEEMDEYYRLYHELKANEKSNLTDYFENKISIYEELKDSLSMKVDDYVNYLEYSPNNEPSNCCLIGYVHNISFFELKRLFNVTGYALFRKNVRKGLKKNPTGEKIKNKFMIYVRVFIYQALIKYPEIANKEIEDGILKDCLNLTDDDLINQRPENFWFYHNGITIFSYDEKAINFTGNHIELNPKMVSVINGAQTMTNFYMGLEKLKRSLKKDLEMLDLNNINLDNILTEANKKITVKTIFISGKEFFVRPITYGLNTQIPVLEEHILADSDDARKLNKILRIKGMYIIKEGDMQQGTTFNVLEFLKKYLIIKCEPGKSKNLRKTEMGELMSQAVVSFKNDSDYYLNSMNVLVELDVWWKNSRKDRINTYVEENDLIINSYGKNYFGSYLIYNRITSLDEEYINVLLNKFIREIKALKNDLSLGDFKSDTLFNDLKKYKNTLQVASLSETGIIERELVEYLKDNIKSPYSVSKVISDFLELRNISLEYFRVIQRVDEKCKESFPFPSSTFSEIYMRDETDEVTNYVNFDDSDFKKEVEKLFKVFVIEKTKIDGDEVIIEVNQINFSFKKYLAQAEKVFDDTIEAFIQGDSQLFPKSSDNCAFHIRPKAKNSDDTFEFSNGEQITKRTFWANKNTVEDIINTCYKDKSI